MNDPALPDRANPTPTQGPVVELPAKPGPRTDRRRVWIARGIAIAADALQLMLFPAFAFGGAFAPDLVLDVVVAATMIGLLGWHVAFLPTAVVELLPIADFFPTWTVAVFFVTRERR